MTSQRQCYLLFRNSAADALRYYRGLFPQPPESGDKESPTGTSFQLSNLEVHCLDVVDTQGVTVQGKTQVVTFNSPDELEKAFHLLSDGGEVLVPITRDSAEEVFAWLKDGLGISWQLTYSPHR